MAFRQLHALHRKRKRYVAAHKAGQGDIFVFIFPELPPEPSRAQLERHGHHLFLAAVTVVGAVVAFGIGLAGALLLAG